MPKTKNERKVFELVVFVFWFFLWTHPVIATSYSVRVIKGKILFEKATCAGCHPAGGNLLHPSKPLKGQEFARKYKSDAEIVKVIRTGIANTGMPAFTCEQINDEELRSILTYIRSLTPSLSSGQQKKTSAKPTRDHKYHK